MQLQTALTILKQLADGADPSTGEIFPPDSPYQHPQTVRALFTAIDHLEEVHKLLAHEEKKPPRLGVRWTRAESEKLKTSFHAGNSVKDLAKQHQRSANSIRAQLLKHNLLPEPEAKENWFLAVGKKPAPKKRK